MNELLTQDLRKLILILISPLVFIFFILADFVYSISTNFNLIRYSYADLFAEIETGVTLTKLFKRNV